MSMLFRTDTHVVRDVAKVNDLKNAVLDSLNKFHQSSAVLTDRPNLFQQLLSLPYEIEKIGNLGLERLRRFHAEVRNVQLPKCLENVLKRKLPNFRG